MTTTRFDVDEAAPYGSCSNCPAELATEADARSHMDATLAASEDDRSHSIRVTNPSRPSRIKREVQNLVDDATEDFVGALEDLVDRGDVTEDEATAAVGSWSDFADAWHRRDQ